MSNNCGTRLSAIFLLVGKLQPTSGTRPINYTPAYQPHRCLFV